MSHGAEIRRYRRYPVRKIVSCRNGGRKFLALTVNLSLGGMKIDAPHPLETNQHLRSELVLDRKLILSEGRVVYSYRDLRSQVFTGIEFVEIAEEDRKALKTFLMKQKKSPQRRQSLFREEEHPFPDANRDTDKSREQLIEELSALRNRLATFEWERKESTRAFLALDETEERLQGLAELLPVGVAEYDLEMNLKYANRFLYEMSGYTEEDFKREPDISQVLAPEELERARKAIKRIASGEAVGSGEYRLVRKGGERFYGEVNSVAIVRDGRVVGIRSVIQEISDRKHAEETLRKQTEILRTIIDEIPVMLCFYDVSGAVKLVNRSFERLVGWSLEELIKTDVMRECYPDPEYRKQVWDYMMKATSEWRDFRVRCRNGDYLESSWANVRLSDGSQIGIGIDITKRREADEALRESESRLRHLSFRLLTAQEDERRRMARDLHDSIGSALAAIKMGLSRKLEQMGNAAPPPGMSLEEIMDSVQYAAAECRRIQGDLRPAILDDIGLLAAIGWHCREFGKFCSHIRVENEIQAEEGDIPEPLKIVMYRVLQESLNNIQKHSGADRANVYFRKSDEAIELCVKDNGQGFDPEEIELSGHAKGMGLDGMQERVRLSGGSFHIESGKGAGTTIRAVWPCKDGVVIGQ